MPNSNQTYNSPTTTIHVNLYEQYKFLEEIQVPSILTTIFISTKM